MFKDNKGVVTNYVQGKATKQEVGEVREVLPLQKEGAKTVLAMLKGGGAQVLR